MLCVAFLTSQKRVHCHGAPKSQYPGDSGRMTAIVSPGRVSFLQSRLRFVLMHMRVQQTIRVNRAEKWRRICDAKRPSVKNPGEIIARAIGTECGYDSIGHIQCFTVPSRSS
jgi:hypothetical protein